MKEKRLLYFALGVSSVVMMGQAMALRNDGLQFPDGSVQTTAAGSSPDAWPMICADNSVAVSVLEALVCASSQSGVPGGSFTTGDPVPAGYFFVVTDFHLRANTTTQTGYVEVLLLQSGGPGVVFVLPADLPSQTFNFRSPILIVPSGQFLAVSNSSSSDFPVEVRVTGYLTTNPERLGP